MAVTLLSQLPESYSVFYTSLITSGRMTMITWDELVPQVLDQEDRNQNVRSGGLQGRAASVTTEALAVPSTSARPPRQRAGPRNQQTASTPAAPRTAPRAAPRPRQRTREELDALRAQRTCNGCGERGHYWRQCPHSRDTTAPSSSNLATTTNPLRLPAFVVDVTEGPAADDLTLSQREWITNSGVT